MRRQVPRRLILLGGGCVTTVALLLGLMRDLGASGPWIAVAVTGGIATALVLVAPPRGDVTIAEGLLVLCIAVAAYSTAKTVELHDRLEARSGPRLHAKRPVFDFVVYAGEPDPDNVYSVTTDYAYERLEPAAEGAAGSIEEHAIGDHVAVVCSPSYSDRWYRLSDGNFMHTDVIKAAPYSGQAIPPECPRNR